MAPDMFPLCPIIRDGWNELLIYSDGEQRVWRSKDDPELYFIDWVHDDLIEAVKVREPIIEAGSVRLY